MTGTATGGLAVVGVVIEGTCARIVRYYSTLLYICGKHLTRVTEAESR
ncbi:MAG TPA: hypothetical protein HPP94_04135 [Desulfuromonadales bacterium]|nr:hypothetical protein [Desulfuromonadales bacterium]